MQPDIALDGARIGAAITSFLLGGLVVRLISQGQTPLRILAECVLIGAVVYLLTVVVRPPAQSSVASATIPDATNASISASDFPN